MATTILTHTTLVAHAADPCSPPRVAVCHNDDCVSAPAVRTFAAQLNRIFKCTHVPLPVLLLHLVVPGLPMAVLLVQRRRRLRMVRRAIKQFAAAHGGLQYWEPAEAFDEVLRRDQPHACACILRLVRTAAPCPTITITEADV